MTDGWTRAGVRVAALAAIVAGLAALGAASVAGAAAPSACRPAAAWGTPRQDLVRDVFVRLNADRAKHRLAPLRLSPELMRAALWKSLHMAGHAYLAHADPGSAPRSTGERLLACGYPARSAGWGENIAVGFESPADVVAGWLDSPGHRRNIETRTFTTIGIGVAASSSGRLYWTTDFGTAAATLR